MSSHNAFFTMEQYDAHASYNPTGASYDAYPQGAIDAYLMPNHTTIYFHRNHSSQDSSDHSGSFVSPASVHAFLPESSPSVAPHHGASSSLSSIEHLFNGIFELEPALRPTPEGDFADAILIDAALQPVAPQYISDSRIGSPIELLPKTEAEAEAEAESVSPPAQSQLVASVQPSALLPSDDTLNESSSTNIQSAALQLIACEELRTNEPIPRHLLHPFLQKVPYAAQRTKGPGSRDGPLAYRCLWSNCDHEPIKRRDHALDHIAAHVGSKPYKCSECDLRFLRKADRRRHIDTRSHSKSKNERSKSVSVEVCPPALLPWLTFLHLEWFIVVTLGMVLKMKTMGPPHVTV